MKIFTATAGLLSLASCSTWHSRAVNVSLFPANKATNVNPDTRLVLTFSSPPILGTSGNITIHDGSGKLVDRLNLAIPPSPSPYGNGSTKANYSDTNTYQTNIIGGMDFYYFPVIIREHVATIYLHNNRLEYNQTYSAKIDPGVLRVNDANFDGVSTWEFSTKAVGPASASHEVTVAADGSADFNTVQGAIDWAPINSPTKTTIRIEAGNYEELVYFQYKSNLVIRGQSRNKTIVGYPNNSAFNPPNRQGPSRRPAFSFKGVTDVQLSDFTINNYYRGQAESLLIDGTRVIIDAMNLNGSGDALTTYGTAYITEITLWGDGDTILGYGSVFWNRSTVISTAGPVSWPRTMQGIHGNVMLDCTIISQRGNNTFARLPDNKGGVMPNWPYAEMVLLNTKTKGIAPSGWGPVQGPPFETGKLRLWEFNTMDLDGRVVDYSQRLNVSKQLHVPEDEETVRMYSDPSFVLGGWTPVVA